MSCPIRSGLVPLIQRSVQRGGVLSAAHHRTSTSMVCVRCFSSPPAGSPVMVGIPKEFTRGPEDKRLVNHSGEESIVSIFAWKHTFLFEMNSTVTPGVLVLCLSIYSFIIWIVQTREAPFQCPGVGTQGPSHWSWWRNGRVRRWRRRPRTPHRVHFVGPTWRSGILQVLCPPLHEKGQKVKWSKQTSLQARRETMNQK